MEPGPVGPKLFKTYETPSGIFSHLLFFTMTIDHKEMSRDEANHFITTKGKGISRFFTRFEKCIKGGYSKVIVKESTTSGYPAVHVILYLETPLKVRLHRKSGTYRPDPTDPYTESVLRKLASKNRKTVKKPSVSKTRSGAKSSKAKESQIINF